MCGSMWECVGIRGNAWEYVGRMQGGCVAHVVGNVDDAGNDVKDGGQQGSFKSSVSTAGRRYTGMCM